MQVFFSFSFNRHAIVKVITLVALISYKLEYMSGFVSEHTYENSFITLTFYLFGLDER